MIINQLFIDKPPIDLLNKIIISFGLSNINDTREFSQIDINKHNTIQTFNKLENELRTCYIPCKRNTFNVNLISKPTGIITIFRQILKAHNYDLYSKEKYIKNKKYLVYKIVTKQEKTIKTMKNTKKHKTKHPKEVVIVFD